MKKNNKGFTLVELIVVIAILGVLMAVLVPQYIQYVEKSKQGTDASALGEILHAAETEAALASTAPSQVLITINGNDAVVSSTPEGFASAVTKITGTGIKTKSKAATAADKSAIVLSINFDANGKATWAETSKTYVESLSAGTAAIAGAPTAAAAS